MYDHEYTKHFTFNLFNKQLKIITFLRTHLIIIKIYKISYNYLENKNQFLVKYLFNNIQGKK